jgi:hypothetical protein
LKQWLKLTYVFSSRRIFDEYWSADDEVELRQEEDYQPDEDGEVKDLSVSPLDAESAFRMRAWLKFKLRKVFAPQLDYLSILD